MRNEEAEYRKLIGSYGYLTQPNDPVEDLSDTAPCLLCGMGYEGTLSERLIDLLVFDEPICSNCCHEVLFP